MDENVKTIIPENYLELIELAEKIYARHALSGENSPLLCLKEITWEEFGYEVSRLHSLCDYMENNNSCSMECIKKRNNLISKLKQIVEESYDLLSETYKNNIQELEIWGFEIDKCNNI